MTEVKVKMIAGGVEYEKVDYQDYFDRYGWNELCNLIWEEIKAENPDFPLDGVEWKEEARIRNVDV